MKRFVQFIAGAICPNCKALDTIALNKYDDEIYCVKSDYIEQTPKEKESLKSKQINVVNLEDFKKNKK